MRGSPLVLADTSVNTQQKSQMLKTLRWLLSSLKTLLGFVLVATIGIQGVTQAAKIAFCRPTVWLQSEKKGSSSNKTASFLELFKEPQTSLISHMFFSKKDCFASWTSTRALKKKKKHLSLRKPPSHRLPLCCVGFVQCASVFVPPSVIVCTCWCWCFTV